jgi:hypothetical protein
LSSLGEGKSFNVLFAAHVLPPGGKRKALRHSWPEGFLRHRFSLSRLWIVRGGVVEA